MLKRKIRQKRIVEAARQYQVFLDTHPNEAISMKAWETAQLDQVPQRKRRQGVADGVGSYKKEMR